MDRLRKKGAPGLLSAAVFPAFFSPWGAELLPKAAGWSFRNSYPEEIGENVTRMADRVSLDGQQNECDMTLREPHKVGKAFNKVLSAISPNRVEYPNTPASGVR